MAYRGATIIPLVFALVILFQGLVELGIFVYFQYMAPVESSSIFCTTYCILWSGGWNIFASLSLIFILSTAVEERLRQIRFISLILFGSIFIVQSISWILCEILEFRLYLTAKNRTSIEERTLVHAYFSSTVTSVMGISIGMCGFFYIIIIFYRLANVLFRDQSEVNVITRNAHRPVCRTEGSPGIAASSAPAALAPRSSETADSWHFVGFRSSTPKAKTDLIRQKCKKGQKRRAGLESIRKRNLRLDISDDEFNRSAPLRMIATIRPQVFADGRDFPPDDIDSPSLEECFSPTAPKSNDNCDRSKPGCEMSTFLQDTPVKNLAIGIRPKRHVRSNAIVHWPDPPAPPPPPPPLNDCQIGAAPQKPVVAQKWRLPTVPNSKVAKALPYSQDHKKEENQRRDALHMNIHRISSSGHSEEPLSAPNHF